MRVFSTSGNATFSSTVIESNSAPAWNSIPNFSLTRSRLRELSRVTSIPSIIIWPESGRSSRFKCFKSTVLPHPLGPIIVVILPRGQSRLTPLRTCCVPKRRRRSRTMINGSVFSPLMAIGQHSGARNLTETKIRPPSRAGSCPGSPLRSAATTRRRTGCFAAPARSGTRSRKPRPRAR